MKIAIVDNDPTITAHVVKLLESIDDVEIVTHKEDNDFDFLVGQKETDLSLDHLSIHSDVLIHHGKTLKDKKKGVSKAFHSNSKYSSKKDRRNKL